MKYLESMIVWNRDTADIDVVPWPDKERAADGYRSSVGACFGHVHEMSEEARIAQVFVDFHAIVVRDHVPLSAAHKAFLKIDEYRKTIAPEIPGSENESVF